MLSKKATKIDEIFIVDLSLTTYCQIDGEDFVNFCGLLREPELYISHEGGGELENGNICPIFSTGKNP